jgi:hypothetical protein
MKPDVGSKANKNRHCSELKKLENIQLSTRTAICQPHPGGLWRE